MKPAITRSRRFYNNGIKLWVDDQLVISHWRQCWLPWWNIARVHFEAGHRYHLKLEWTAEQGAETMQLFWKKPSHRYQHLALVRGRRRH